MKISLKTDLSRDRGRNEITLHSPQLAGFPLQESPHASMNTMKGLAPDISYLAGKRSSMSGFPIWYLRTHSHTRH